MPDEPATDVFALIRIKPRGPSGEQQSVLSTDVDELEERVVRLGASPHLIWPDAEMQSLYLLVERSAGAEEMGTELVASLEAELLPIEEARLDDVQRDPTGHYLVGTTRRDLLMSVPPDILTCPSCGADLTIEGHRPGCPYRR
jgi:hypothetical protein